MPLAGAQKRAITEKDLFSFVWIADPQIAPDGSQVAFVRVSTDEKSDQDRNVPLDREERTAASSARRSRPAGTRDNVATLVARRFAPRIRAGRSRKTAVFAGRRSDDQS